MQIPRRLLIGLILTLAVSLFGLAFLLGRQSAAPTVVASATPQPRPPQLAAEWSVPEESADTQRLRSRSNFPKEARSATPSQDAVMAKSMLAIRRAERAAHPRPRPRVVEQEADLSVPKATAPTVSSASVPDHSPAAEPGRQTPRSIPGASRHSTTAKPSAPVQPASASNSQIRAYFAQIDALAGAQGVGDPSQVATDLLSQSLQGDSSGMDALLQSTQSALIRLRGIHPPASCREHHNLLVKQLQQGIALLGGVGHATEKLDTSSLAKLSSQGRSMQAEAQRFAELDRQLRARI